MAIAPGLVLNILVMFVFYLHSFIYISLVYVAALIMCVHVVWSEYCEVLCINNSLLLTFTSSLPLSQEDNNGQ